jgi:hypothetical protein
MPRGKIKGVAMSTLLAGLLVSLLKRMVSEVFLAKIIVEAMRAWSDQTENAYDDRVVDAIAEALGVESKSLKVMMQKPK